jgi:hypothetical protein
MRGNRSIQVRGSTHDICECIQNAIFLWFLANKPVVEEIDVGHLFYEKVGRFVYVDGARRVECDPYLSRTVGEMHASSCRINDPLPQECPHRLIAVHWVTTSFRIVDTLLVQVLVEWDSFIWNIALLEKRADIFKRGLDL